MFQSIFNVFTLIGIITITGLLAYYKFSKRSGNKKVKISANAGVWWLCIFLFGLVLYLYAFFQIPKTEEQSIFSYVLSTITISIQTSLRMFTYIFYYEKTVKDIADNNLLYCVLIVFCYFAAIIWTTIMAKNIFLKGIANEIKLKVRGRFFQGRNNYHYIIVGCEHSMKLFLKDLLENEKVNKKNITVITGDVADQGVKAKEMIDEGYAVIKGRADEAALRKAGIDNTKRKIKVIAITESDEQNLTVANIITQKIFSIVCPGKEHTDITAREEIIKALPCKDMKTLENINLEAHIMYSFIEKTEYFAFTENAFGKVDFFNPYELRVRDFFWKTPITSLIPDLLDFEKARLKGEFNDEWKICKADGKEYIIKNIFVGFGAANYQMLKGSVLTGQILGCDYRATIYDENISENKPSIRQAMFMNHASGLFGGKQTLNRDDYLDSPKEKYNIKFYHANVLSRDFYLKSNYSLIDEIEENDFTVIYVALGEDKLNIETACEIRQCLYEHGIVSSKKVHIFVKTSDNSVYNNDLVINNPQSIINNDKNNAVKTQCFGLDSSVLTNENIVNEKLNCFTRAVSNKKHGIRWEFLSETKRDSNRHVAMAIKTKLNLLGFSLLDNDDGKSGENISSDEYYERYKGACNERIAEIIDLSKEIAMHDGQESQKQNEAKLSGYTLDYVQTENGVICDTPRNNLARLEHLRWNTFHYVQGWSMLPISKIEAGNAGRQNRFTKQHACITTFEGLIHLRELQAKKAMSENPDIPLEKAEYEADTLQYDYHVMDELPIRLQSSNKNMMKI